MEARWFHLARQRGTAGLRPLASHEERVSGKSIGTDQYRLENGRYRRLLLRTLGPRETETIGVGSKPNAQAVRADWCDDSTGRTHAQGASSGCGGEQPVLLEDLPAHAGVRAVAEAVSGALRRQTPVT